MLFRAFAFTYNINEYLKQQNMFFSIGKRNVFMLLTQSTFLYVR